MNSRTGLMLGVAGLGVITGAIVWFTQVDSRGGDATPAGPTAKPTTAPAVALGQELAPTEGLKPPAQRQGGKPAAAGQSQQPASDRKTVSQPPVAPPSIAHAGAVENAVPAPVMPGTEPEKLPSLDPIVGGAAAIKGRYTGSTYAERQERAERIQNALDGNGNPDKDQAEVYQALKDELVWLRENMGTQPNEPQKPK